MVQLELDGEVAIILTSVMVSGGMPRRAALCAACKGPGPLKLLAMLAAAAAGTAFLRARRFFFFFSPYFDFLLFTLLTRRKTFLQFESLAVTRYSTPRPTLIMRN